MLSIVIQSAFNPDDPDLVLELMNTHLLGFPIGTVQHQRASEMLQRYFMHSQQLQSANTDDFQLLVMGTLVVWV